MQRKMDRADSGSRSFTLDPFSGRISDGDVKKEAPQPSSSTCMLLIFVSIWYGSAIIAITATKEIMNRIQFPFLLCVVQFTVASASSYIYLKYSNQYKSVPSELAMVVSKVATSYTFGFVTTNVSFSLASAAAVETVKAAEPLSTVLLGLLLLGESYSAPTYLSLLPICGGVALSCYNNQATLSFLGFCIIVASNICFSARAVFTKSLNSIKQQQQQQQQQGSVASLSLSSTGSAGAVTTCTDSISTVAVAMGAITSPAVAGHVGSGSSSASSSSASIHSFDEVNLFHAISLRGLCFLVPIALIMEGRSILNTVNDCYEHNFMVVGRNGVATGVSMLLCLFLLNGLLFSSYNLMSYVVLRRTSLVTHSVLNVFRRVFIIFFTSIYFALPPSLLSSVGIVTATMGVLSFGYFRRQQQQQQQSVNVHKQ